MKLNTINFIKNNQKRLDVECEAPKDHPTCFHELIKKTSEKYNQKVVILIDESKEMMHISNLHFSQESLSFPKLLFLVDLTILKILV